MRKIELRLAALWPKGTSVATTEQLSDAQMGSRFMAESVRLGVVHRIRKGAYIRSNEWNTIPPWEQTKLRLLAHMLTSRGRPVYSHFSAAHIHGLDVWDCPGTVHVTTSFAVSAQTSAQDVVAHHRPLDLADIVEPDLPRTGPALVTSLERTVVDCARSARFDRAVVIGDSALRKGANIESMRAMVEAMPGHRGVRKARRVLDALDGRSESAGETRTRLILARMAIEQPELQVTINSGGQTYRADFAWRALMLILEFDGRGKYFDYRPTDEALFQERRREKELMEQGWRFIRVEWKDLDRPEELMHRVRQAMAAARRSVG